ncbi:MAG TPA: endonuclease/exonuclease/phosphatase family protein, partial [Povalibacter sp.]
HLWGRVRGTPYHVIATDFRQTVRSFTQIAAAATALCACAAFLIGFAGRWWWVADLFAHFRVQYTWMLAISALLLLLLRRYRAALLAFGATLVLLLTILRYFSWGAPPVATAADFRFVTFNKYWRNQAPQRIGRFIEDSGADVFVLQEVSSAQTVQDVVGQLPSYPHVYAVPDPPLGSVILSRWPIIERQTIELAPGGARVAKVVIDWHGRRLTVIGAHLHWPLGPQVTRLRNSELEELAQLARHTRGPLLIGGDFNITPWSQNFERAIAGTSLRDCVRGQGWISTWPTQFAPLGLRIDHCLYSEHWRVVSVRRGPILGSDHYPMINDLVLLR